MDDNKKLAVLIDADNASADIVENLFKEIAKYGIASVKRIYGNWEGQRLKKWKEELLPFAITPIQQFDYTKQKNATDITMVIDTMDLLYSEVFDGFCIVSSDSDFTRLATRIRENGLIVYGFGEKKTPEAFIKSCDKFIYTNNFSSKKEENSNQTKPQSTSTNLLKIKKLKSNTTLMNLLRDAIDSASDDNGWAYLGPIGNYINRISPGFDTKNYGFNNLSDLIKSIDLFKTKPVGSHIQVSKK